jgi:hypothetical protein
MSEPHFDFEREAMAQSAVCCASPRGADVRVGGVLPFGTNTPMEGAREYRSFAGGVLNENLHRLQHRYGANRTGLARTLKDLERHCDARSDLPRLG